MAPSYFERASSQLSEMFVRMKREYRGSLNPLVYEAYLIKLEGVLRHLRVGDFASAEGRLYEIEAELAAELPYPGDPIEHEYSDDVEDWLEYGETYEQHIADTADRLRKLATTVRGSRSRLAPNVYEAFARKVTLATINLRDDCLHACDKAEDARRVIEAELAIHAVEIE